MNLWMPSPSFKHRVLTEIAHDRIASPSQPLEPTEQLHGLSIAPCRDQPRGVPAMGWRCPKFRCGVWMSSDLIIRLIQGSNHWTEWRMKCEQLPEKNSLSCHVLFILTYIGAWRPWAQDLFPEFLRLLCLPCHVGLAGHLCHRRIWLQWQRCWSFVWLVGNPLIHLDQHCQHLCHWIWDQHWRCLKHGLNPQEADDSSPCFSIKRWHFGWSPRWCAS